MKHEEIVAWTLMVQCLLLKALVRYPEFAGEARKWIDEALGHANVKGDISSDADFVHEVRGKFIQILDDCARAVEEQRAKQPLTWRRRCLEWLQRG